MIIDPATPQTKIDLYHSLIHTIANARGNTVQNMPLDSIHYAWGLTKSAHSKAVDKWWVAHVSNLR